MVRLFIFFFCILIFSLPSFAQLFNPELIKRNTVPIVKVEQDLLFVRQNPVFRVGEAVVVVRMEDDDVEVVTQGSVANIQDGFFLIETDKKNLFKLPRVGDRVVSVARLNEAKTEPLGEVNLPPISMGAADPYEPGYVVLDFGPYNGTFASDSPNQANEYKNYSFNFYDTHFLWYFDFLWRLGIEYDSTGGDVPLRSYDRQVRPTTYSQFLFGIHYRFLPFWKELRATAKIVTKSSEFITTNNDEYVVSTTGSGIGLGVNLHYLFGSNTFSSEKKFDWSFNRIYADLVLYPDTHVSDDFVTRGGSGHGMEWELKVGATTLFYIQAVPFFKRFSFDASAGLIQNSLTFEGAPKSAPDGFYTIPAGGTYKENQFFIKFMIGLRMEDWIARSLRSR